MKKIDLSIIIKGFIIMFCLTLFLIPIFFVFANNNKRNLDNVKLINSFVEEFNFIKVEKGSITEEDISNAMKKYNILCEVITYEKSLNFKNCYIVGINKNYCFSDNELEEC